MFENQVPPTSANPSPALSPVMAMEQLIAPIARLWCRSFGVLEEEAVARLTNILLHNVQDDLASGLSLSRIQSHFDELAAQIIRDWFSSVLGRELPGDGKSLAILRLAFLDSNHDGKWSAVFLTRDLCVQELSSELEAMMIEPTPQVAPRIMLRQAF
jgi:hypothetical protein